MKVLVCGEALVDLVPMQDGRSQKLVPIPGGSPLNVAVGLARLGVSTGYLGKLSTDEFGASLFSHLRKNGVGTRFVVRSPRPTTVAHVTTSTGSDPEYTFEIEGTADRSLESEVLPESLPIEIDALHFGSYSLALQPIGTTLTSLMESERVNRVISLDPNVRPALMPNLARHRATLEKWCSYADVIKLSHDDFAYLCPNEAIEEGVHRWLGGTAVLVVVTDGSHGATAYTRELQFGVNAEHVDVIDTIGAGDAFMAGLLASLCTTGLLTKRRLRLLSGSDVERALRFATKVAAITCSRRGADPPSRAQLSRW